MDKVNMAALLSESESEDEVTYRPGQNGERLDGLLTKNRRNVIPKRGRTVVILGLFLSVSAVLNIAFVIALFLKTKEEVVEIQGCPTHSISSELNTTAATKVTSGTPLALVINATTETTMQTTPTTTETTTKTTTNTTSSQEDRDITTTSEAQRAQAESPNSQSESSTLCRSCDIPVCAKPERILQKEQATKGPERKVENVFADLTSQEMAQVYTFLSHDPKLKIGLSSTNCKVYGMELHVPNKTQVYLYLDSYAPKPTREVRVVVECANRGLVYEFVVGPLPNPQYYVKNPRRKSHTIPYRFFPSYGMREAYKSMFRTFGANLDYILNDSYGAKANPHACGKTCVTFLAQRTSSAYSDGTLMVLTAYYKTDFVTINPLDFMVIVRESMNGHGDFNVVGVFYSGQYFTSATSFVQGYKSRTIKKSRMSFPEPVDGETSIRGTLNLRGEVFPSEPQSGPKQFEPEGKRYSIDGQHVKYLQWSFNMRLSTTSGPQIWDVRWAGERIAYEISLQDVGVIYAGANANTFYTHLSDSAFGLGDKATGLLPGLDCPDHATFLPQVIFEARSGTTHLLPHAQCVFEHNTGLPLRRHRNRDFQNGRSHGGVVDRVLIVRSIIVEYNYDYIFDTVFHQNGAIELKTYATGYVMSAHYRHAEDPFGFRIHNEMVGSIHHHLFNFKIDLDIQGASNRYETLDMVTDDRSWPWYKDGFESFEQISFKRNLKLTEEEAVLRYNFSNPKYHIVYNNEKKNVFGNPKAFRIDVKGFSKQILPDDSVVLNSRRWSKYQMAVTKRRDEEEASSSIFSMFDGEDPHVDFDDYLRDDESILDEDLVFWVTVGMHHIPHTEDLPNTPTVGTEATVSLLPYNYFTECPSVGSRDSVRVESKDGKVIMKDYGVSLTSNCVPPAYDYHTLFATPTYLYSD